MSCKLSYKAKDWASRLLMRNMKRALQHQGHMQRYSIINSINTK